MNPEQHNIANLFCLYDSIGKNVRISSFHKSDHYSIVLSPGTEWPGFVYDIDRNTVLKDIIIDLQKEQFEFPGKPIVISVDNEQLDKELRKNGYFPAEQWAGMYRQFSLGENFEALPGETINIIKDKKAIAEWTGIVSEVLFKGKPLSEDIFTYLFTEQHCLAYVEKDNKMIGTTLIYFDKNNVAGIYMVCIKPEFRYMGFGRQLINYSFRLIKDSGVKLCVLQSTKMGLHLYHSMGFERTNTYNLFIKIK